MRRGTSHGELVEIHGQFLSQNLCFSKLKLLESWRNTRRSWSVSPTQPCAQAAPGKVIELWSGLGYNRRAINLHRTAKTIAEKHKGTVPDELSLLLDLPGIGDYTARAILAFSFEKDVAVVDVNVKRVLSRLEGRTLSMKEAQSIADQNLPTGEGWRWNQAMIEIGATICTARKTKCVKCPLKETCTWTKKSSSNRPSYRSKEQKT